MLLQNKNAIIYGAGGSLGGAVARAMAQAGARLFLTGRNKDSVQKTADAILATGGHAEVDIVDGFDDAVIRQHLERVVQKGSTVDISFNAVGIDNKQGNPLVNMGVEDYVSPITHTMQTQFLTATAAGRQMILQGSGTILTLTATPGGIGYPFTGGFAAACAALENFTRNLAAEVGLHGVRVVNIRSGGSPDSRIFQESIKNHPEIMGKVLGSMKQDTMLKDLPLMADIANAAVFLSSAMAAKITGVTIDLTAGTTVALNYRSTTQSDDAPAFVDR